MASDPFIDLAKRVMTRSRQMEEATDKIVQESFLAISQRVINHTPLWSGQARLNWTASASKNKPKRRFVNVQRTNKGSQGHRGNIILDINIAATAAVVAMSAVRVVTATWENSSRPSSALPRALNVRPRNPGRPPALWLSNSIKYVPKLWGGSWPSNPRTLSRELFVEQDIIHRNRLMK